MEELFLRLCSQYGFNALLVAVLLLQTWALERRLLDLVSNNTKAMSELKAAIDAMLQRRRVDDP